ncbi:hypothetical protein JXA47_12260, partial [Candidatus Sumerlaeota bacterium]|nr:hypothetical protein [Candidatus Sumerlaeota bacterium]
IPNEAVQRGEGNERYVEVVVEGASPETTASAPSPQTGRNAAASPERGEGSARRPSGGQGRRPQGSGGASGRNGATANRGGTQGFGDRPSDAELGIVIAEPPPTERRPVRLGVTDGIQTHVIEGLEGDEEILIPIPEWRLEFLRSQAMGDEGNQRPRGMRF